jgi:putative flippase GtrA
MKSSQPIIRFALSGLLTTLTHIAVAYTATMRFALHPGLANGLAFVIANSLSFALNTLWTFRAEASMRTWRRFAAVSLLGAAVSTGIATIVAAAGGHPLLGIALVVSIVPVLSYVAHRRYTYA